MLSRFQTLDGRSIHCRLIQPEDLSLMIHFFHHLSPESRWRRFNIDLTHVGPERIERTARQLAEVDNRTQGGAVMALTEEDRVEILVGVVRLGRDAEDGSRAEVAIVVRDDYQGQGIGSHLLGEVIKLAKEMGVHSLSAVTQHDNEKLKRMIRWQKIPMTERTTDAQTEFVLDLKP